MLRWVIGMVLVTGCASRYAYTFHVEPPAEDGAMRAEVLVEPDAEAVVLRVTNQTEHVLQVDWANITLDGGVGGRVSLRPAEDLGWVKPGATTTAALGPLALPRGMAAHRYQGRRFALTVPMIVRREPKQYRYALVARVRKL